MKEYLFNKVQYGGVKSKPRCLPTTVVKGVALNGRHFNANWDRGEDMSEGRKVQGMLMTFKGRTNKIQLKWQKENQLWH